MLRLARRGAPVLLTAVMAALLVGICAAPARAGATRDAQMWVLDAVDAPAAWQVTRGQGVTVAVLDSGVNPNVSDLTGSVVTGPDLTGIGTSPSNPYWGVHGTWMASLIAGHGHAGGASGILGAAPASKVLSIRVVPNPGDPGYQRYQHESQNRVQNALATAIQYATTHGAAVISMSLGYGSPSQAVRAALQDALDRGVVVVASAGNSGTAPSAIRAGQAPYSFPADYPGVLGVGAVARGGAPANFSSDNLSVQVAAPGVNVPAQGANGGYWLVSGTSPACALTAGVAALIKSRYPALTPALVDLAITGSAQNPPPGGYDSEVGFGTVDAAAALAAAGRLSADTATGAGVGAASHFGGGPAAVPAVPIAPRGDWHLLVYGLAGLASLIVAAAAAVWLVRHPRAGGRRSAHPRHGQGGAQGSRTDGGGQGPGGTGRSGPDPGEPAGPPDSGRVAPDPWA